MAYRKFRSYSKPTPHTIIVKFAGKCACCGGHIAAGSIATFYPAGTIAGVTDGKVAHVGGLDGNSAKCQGIIAAGIDKNVGDYAGDGLDARYEDDCARQCGL